MMAYHADRPGKRKDGRFNHVPKSQYCQGVQYDHSVMSAVEFDELIAATAYPDVFRKIGGNERELTAELYRRAEAVRAARPRNATVEDRIGPVEITRISTVHIASGYSAEEHQ